MTNAPPPETKAVFWYRYDDCRFAAPLDEFDAPIGRGRVGINLSHYQLLRETPKGVWVLLNYSFGFIDPAADPEWVRAKIKAGLARFILHTANRRFACATREEAKASFIARKKRQAGIYSARLRDAKEALALGYAIDTTKEDL